MKITLKRAGLWTLGVVVVACGTWLVLGLRSASRISDAIEAGARAGLPTRTGDLDAFLDRRFGPVASTDNAAPLLEAASATLADVEFPARPEDGGLPAPGDALRAAVAKAESAYPLIEQASRRPRCRYPARWDDGYAVRMPQIEGALRLRAALCARAALRLADGAAPESVAEDARLLAFVADSFREQPTLIAQMVRVAVARDADRVRRALLERSDGAGAGSGAASVRGAVAFGFHGELALLGSAASGSPRPVGPSGEPGPWDRVKWPIVRATLADVLSNWAELAAHGDEPYPAFLARCADVDRRAAGTRDSSAAFRMHVEKLARGEAEMETRRAVTDAGARVLAFRRAQGRWPESLEEAGAAADDPRTATPLTLRAEGEDVVVGPADGVESWTIATPK